MGLRITGWYLFSITTLKIGLYCLLNSTMPVQLPCPSRILAVLRSLCYFLNFSWYTFLCGIISSSYWEKISSFISLDIMTSSCVQLSTLGILIKCVLDLFFYPPFLLLKEVFCIWKAERERKKERGRGSEREREISPSICLFLNAYNRK